MEREKRFHTEPMRFSSMPVRLGLALALLGLATSLSSAATTDQAFGAAQPLSLAFGLALLVVMLTFAAAVLAIASQLRSGKPVRAPIPMKPPMAIALWVLMLGNAAAHSFAVFDPSRWEELRPVRWLLVAGFLVLAVLFGLRARAAGRAPVE